MNWPMVPISSVAIVASGFGFPREYQGFANESIPFFKVADMNLPANKIEMKKCPNFISVETLKKLKAKVYPAGTVIFPKIGAAIATGKKRLLSCEATFDNNIMGLVPKNLVDPYFLYYWSLTFDFISVSNIGPVPSIRKTTVENINFPLPPISEQRRIVEILEQADALRLKRAGAEAKAERILPALFYKMFGDPLALMTQEEAVELKDCKVELQNGFACGIKDVSGGIPHLRMNNIDDRGVLNLDLIRTVPNENDHEKYRLQEGNVLFMSTNSEDKIGKACVFYQPSEGHFLFSNHLTRIRLQGSDLTSEYLASYLHLLWQKGYYPNIAKRWVNQATVSQQALGNIKVAVPKKTQAETFSLAAIKALWLQKRSDDSRQQLSTLFSTLLHRAFSGDLTAKWREEHMKELLVEMEEQSKVLINLPKVN